MYYLCVNVYCTTATGCQPQLQLNISYHNREYHVLTLILLTWRIWCAPTNASKRQMGFNLAFNPLNSELNPIWHLLALLGVHFLHVSRIRVKSLTLRLLMSYIYIWSINS